MRCLMPPRLPLTSYLLPLTSPLSLPSMQIPVLSPEQSNAWDDLAVGAGIDRVTLLESAGRATATVLGDRFAHLPRAGGLAAAGPGNNGGDGWVLARALHRADVPVWVAALPSGSELCTRDAQVAPPEGGGRRA